jgi:prepilin-type N-terminal cleavage/methylation domain-containing protein
MRKNNGFTLLEILIAVIIIAAVSAVATPAALSWLDGARLKSAAASLRADLQEAKSQALRRRETVRIEFSGDEYIIFVDTDQSGEFDDDEPVIRKRQMPGGVKLEEGATVITGGLEEQANSAGEEKSTSTIAGGKGAQGKEDKSQGGGGGNLIKGSKGKSKKSPVAGTSPSTEGTEPSSRQVSFDSLGMCPKSGNFTFVNKKGERWRVDVNLVGSIKSEKLTDSF